MKILENSRQIPKGKEQYLSNLKYCDYLYSYLQVISKWSGKPGDLRYVPKKDCSFVAMAEALGVTRQTVSKKFKSMVEGQPDSIALIRKQKDKYILLPIQKNLAMLVPYGTLQVLTSTVTENVISIYVYLLNRYLANYQQRFRYTVDQLKSVIGISTKTRSNNYIISSILLLLEKLGLLKKQTYKDENQTYSFIEWMTNQIDDLPDQLKNQFGKNYDDLLKKCTQVNYVKNLDNVC